jgi:hypothetical protein
MFSYLGEPAKKELPKANALRTILGKEQNIDDETNAETCTPSKNWHE